MSDLIFNRIKVYGADKEVKKFIHTLAGMLSGSTINGNTVEFKTHHEPAFYILEMIMQSNSKLSLLLDYKSRNRSLTGFIFAHKGMYLGNTYTDKIPTPKYPLHEDKI